MYRLSLLAAATVCMIVAGSSSASAQQSRPRGWGWSAPKKERPARVEAKPVQQAPVELNERMQAVVNQEGDSLSQPEIARRIAAIYRSQSELLEADARGDAAKVEALLNQAVADLGVLARQPGVMEEPRFRELYRTVVMEYERFYEVSSDLAVQQGDIFEFREEAFAAIGEMDGPLLEDVELPATLPTMHTQVPMVRNRLVEQSISYLLRNPDKHINGWMRRAETYFPMIEQVLREEGVPDELKYLAMIESGLNPRAESWAAAAGMWQFITATGSAYGLKVNHWVDERKDPEKATRAAARHLKDLHQMFGGDWHLALAGYNCNPARIRRAIQRAEARLGRKATFWDIYDDIPKETRGYVPMFIAASLVASNPTSFGLKAPAPGPRYAYDHVPVAGSMRLDQIASMAGTDVETIRALNPEIRQRSTPPAQGGYLIRLPLGSYQQFAAAFESRGQQGTLLASVEHNVRRGETISKIARKYGVTVEELKRANRMESSKVRPGQTLEIPAQQYEGGELLASAKPVSVQYGSRILSPIQSVGSTSGSRTASAPVRQASEKLAARSTEAESRPSARQVSDEPAPQRQTHRVRRGESLGKIAARYGVSVSDLRSWNNIRGSKITVGQRLTIYKNGGAVASKTPVRRASATSSTVTHRVRRGETLAEIGQRYGVTVSQIKSWNRLRSNTIRVNQRLKIQTSSGRSASTYDVQRGDSLAQIASRHGVSVADLKRWNDLSGDQIVPGQQLRIE